MEGLDVAVVGGSLGGLTAACLLRDDGHRVTIYERSPTPLEQRGAGIALLRTTSRYLIERIGVAAHEVGVPTDRIRYLSGDGSIAHDDQQHYLFSSWNTVFRQIFDHWNGTADGAARYLHGHEMVEFTQDGERVEVNFGNGGSATVDLLVCPDGVGSTGRAKLQPQARPTYAGYVAWRGAVPERELTAATAALLGDAITYYVYANSHVLVYPIPSAQGSVEPGERLINLVWYRNYAAGEPLDDLLTDRDGQRRELSIPPGKLGDRHDHEARAAAAVDLPPAIAEVVARTEDLFVQVIYDVAVERVAFDRVALLGDAAFNVRPHAAAGTAKACDDGWELAARLAHEVDIGAALKAWEATQLDLGRTLLERTRSIGRRSQVDNSWVVGDPDLVFGLYEPGH